MSSVLVWTRGGKCQGLNKPAQHGDAARVLLRSSRQSGWISTYSSDEEVWMSARWSFCEGATEDVGN